MPSPWGSPETILALLADRLGKADKTMPAVGPDAADRAGGRAYNDVRNALLARQYLAPQVELWDRRDEFFFDLTTFFLLADLAIKSGAGLEAIKVYDRRAELRDVVVTIGGVVVVPGSTAPGDPGATIGFGGLLRPASIDPRTGYPYDRQPPGYGDYGYGFGRAGGGGFR